MHWRGGCWWWTEPTGPICRSWEMTDSSADLVVTSAHKTSRPGAERPAAGRERFPPCRAGGGPPPLRLLQPLLSHDGLAWISCRAWMEEEGAAAYRAAARQVAGALRRDYPACPARRWTLPGWCSAPPTALSAQAALEGMGVASRWPTRAMGVHPHLRRHGGGLCPPPGRPGMPWPGGRRPLPPASASPEAVLTPVRPSFPRISSPCPPRRDASAPSRWPPHPPWAPVFAPGERICKNYRLFETNRL